MSSAEFINGCSISPLCFSSLSGLLGNAISSIGSFSYLAESVNLTPLNCECCIQSSGAEFSAIHFVHFVHKTHFPTLPHYQPWSSDTPGSRGSTLALLMVSQVLSPAFSDFDEQRKTRKARNERSKTSLDPSFNLRYSFYPKYLQKEGKKNPSPGNTL